MEKTGPDSWNKVMISQQVIVLAWSCQVLGLLTLFMSLMSVLSVVFRHWL